MVFYVIFIIHTMLPTSRKVAFVLGVITGGVDIILVALLGSTMMPDSVSWKTKRVSGRGLRVGCGVGFEDGKRGRGYKGKR